MGEFLLPGIPKWPAEPADEALGFVLPGAEIDLDGVAEAFRRQLPDESVRAHRVGGRVEVVAAFGDEWMVRVLLNDGIRSDAEHMATEGFLRDHPRAAEIAACDRLVVVMVADPEVSVAAFEVQEAARGWLVGQPGVIAVRADDGKPL
jgi:hypothetical protein